MNDTKTGIMELHSPYTPYPLHEIFNLDDCEIIPSETTKNLGFWFDENLSLDKQIKNVVKTCNNNLRKIGRIGSRLAKHMKIQLVHGLIHSVLDYCNGTYYSLTGVQLQKLQKIQNSAARLILGLKGKKRFQPITPKLQELHFLPIKYRIQFKISLLVFKCLNNIAPPYLSSLLSLRKINTHFLRADNDFFLLDAPQEPRCKKTLGSFSHCAPKVWNNLPYYLRTHINVNAFKRDLKTYLFQKAFVNQ